jgi:predicted nucleic acid-binding protein
LSLVVDASVALAWCFEDEASPATDAIAERVREEGAYVPSLWHLELGNVLIQAEKRQRITAAELTSRLELIGTLPILTDFETSSRAWREVLALARVTKLTTYDAAYLELAMRRGLPLASRDTELTTAAQTLGVALLL